MKKPSTAAPDWNYLSHYHRCSNNVSDLAAMETEIERNLHASGDCALGDGQVARTYSASPKTFPQILDRNWMIAAHRVMCPDSRREQSKGREVIANSRVFSCTGFSH